MSIDYSNNSNKTMTSKSPVVILVYDQMKPESMSSCINWWPKNNPAMINQFQQNWTKFLTQTYFPDSSDGFLTTITPPLGFICY